MEDIFFKYGVIMIGVAVIVLLMSFAYTSLSKTIVTSEEREQSIKGSLFQIRDRVQDLCDNCLRVDVNRECFILSYESGEAGEICQDKFGDDVSVPECVSGKGVIKINSEEKTCIVKVVSRIVPKSACLECVTEDCCSSKAITDNCFWHADGVSCIPKTCAMEFLNGCTAVTTKDCCDAIAWACGWSGTGCVTK